jgi:nucleotide-binding universal stress UspA family protein
MDLNRSLMPLTGRRPDRASERPDRGAQRRMHRPRLEAGIITGHVRDRDLDVAQPANRAERPAEPACTFNSVLCGIDGSASAHAAREQAELLASPGGTVELVPAPQLTHEGHRALTERCEGHDLLALGAGAAARAAVEHTPIPILIARWSAPGTRVTDTVLVAVDDSPESSRAVELAGRLAAVHGSTVTIVGAPPRDRAFQRAIAASSRVLLHSTGATPRLFNEQLPPERAIPSAAASLPASLLVLGAGSSETARKMTLQIADRVRCSVLAVPARGPIARAEEPSAPEPNARPVSRSNREPLTTGPMPGPATPGVAGGRRRLRRTAERSSNHHV